LNGLNAGIPRGGLTRARQIASKRKAEVELELTMRTAVFALAGALALAPLAAFAAAGPAPLPEPDPRTRNMSPYQIQLRTFDACLLTQSRLQNTTREAVHSACSCYARGTVTSMTRAEIQSFRETSVFNDSARVKALAQIDRCRLVRPI
jgi:hypothetical protein